MAAAFRGTRTLRTRRREQKRCGRTAPHYELVFEWQPPFARAGLGRSRHSRTRAVFWQSFRFRLPAGVGTFGVYQAGALAQGRQNLRPAAANGKALSGSKATSGALGVAFQQ